VETDVSLVSPHGSIVDIALEDAGQRQLYLIGVAGTASKQRSVCGRQGAG
jgi:hypothetical protein